MLQPLNFCLQTIQMVNLPSINLAYEFHFNPDSSFPVTFYKVQVESAELKWNIGRAAILVELENGIKFDSNDLGAHQYRKVTSLSIPKISVCLLLTASLERNRWLEAAKVDLDVYLDMYASPVGHRSMTRKQLNFIEDQDRMTGRAKTMFNQLRQKTKTGINSGVFNTSQHKLMFDHLLLDRSFHLNGVYIPQPTLPDLSSPSATFNPSSQVQPSLPRPQSWRFSTLRNLSDSENEEGVSEADRDARLA